MWFLGFETLHGKILWQYLIFHLYIILLLYIKIQTALAVVSFEEVAFKQNYCSKKRKKIQNVGYQDPITLLLECGRNADTI